MGAQPFVKYAVLSLLALPMHGVHALGLGDAELRSSLGAPLELRIPVRHLGNLSGDDLRLVLSPTEDGISGLPLESKVRSKYTLTYDPKAQAAILRSDAAVVEPYIAFTLNVLWPGGYLKREYTVLMDLPDIALDQRIAETSTSPKKAASAADVKTSKPRSKPSARTTHRQTLSKTDRQYRVARGDSLWTLAGSLSRQRGGSREHWMASLFLENPRAFVRGEPERLKEAWVLDIPVRSGESRLVFTRGSKGYELITPSSRVADVAPSERSTRGPSEAMLQEESSEELVIAEIERNALTSSESLPQTVENREPLSTSKSASRNEMLERVAVLEAKLAEVRAKIAESKKPAPDVEAPAALALGVPLLARLQAPVLRSFGWTALGMVLGLGCLFAREWRLHRRLSAVQRRLSGSQGWDD